jgi:hypothetical protein
MGRRVRLAAYPRVPGRTGEARPRGDRRTGQVAGWASRQRRRAAAGRDHAADHLAGRAPGRGRAGAAPARRVAASARRRKACDRRGTVVAGHRGPMAPNRVPGGRPLPGRPGAAALLAGLGLLVVPAVQEVVPGSLARGHRGERRAGRAASTRSSGSAPGPGASVDRYRGPAARRRRRESRPGGARGQGPRKRRHAAGGLPGSVALRRALTAGPAGASRPWRRRTPPGRPGRPPRDPGPREGPWWRYARWDACWSGAL